MQTFLPISPTPGLFIVLCGAGNFGKNSVCMRTTGIQYTERSINKYTCNYTYNFTCIFFDTSSVIKIYQEEKFI